MINEGAEVRMVRFCANTCGVLQATLPTRGTIDLRDQQSGALSHDGKLAATIVDEQNAVVWDVDTGKEIARLPHVKRILQVAFSPDGHYLLTCGDDQTSLWQIGYWQTPDAVLGPARLAAFSPDGSTLASAWSANYSTDLQIYDLKTRSVKRTIAAFEAA